jgi:hypothetical protein
MKPDFHFENAALLDPEYSSNALLTAYQRRDNPAFILLSTPPKKWGKFGTTIIIRFKDGAQ